MYHIHPYELIAYHNLKSQVLILFRNKFYAALFFLVFSLLQT